MDKHKIIEAVKGGLSYSEAARAFGTTRGAVAGMCNRAGVKVGPRPDKAGEALRASWRRKSAAEKEAVARARGRAISQAIANLDATEKEKWMRRLADASKKRWASHNNARSGALERA